MASSDLQHWAEPVGISLVAMHERGDQAEHVYQILPDQDGLVRFLRIRFPPPW